MKKQEFTNPAIEGDVPDPIEDATPPPAPIEPAAPEVPEPIEVSEIKPASRVRIFRNYGGRPTDDQRLQPGVYRVEDLARYMDGNLPAYLVANGHGEWV